MDAVHRRSAETARSQIARERAEPSLFRASLTRVPAAERDAWLDLVLDLGELPDDGPELPRGCVPYVPCPVDTLLRVVEHAPVRASDVFVDIGSGAGRATALVHLLTGATVMGLEIQPALVRAARDLFARLHMSRASCAQGDAASLAGQVRTGTVFFLYCPFSGDRLAKLVADLEPLARTRMIRVCCVDVPLPPCPWLTPAGPARPGDLAIYRSTLHQVTEAG